jgi:hypothetical protein
MFAVIVLAAGLVVPLGLSLIPGFEDLIYEKGVLTTSEDLESRVSFLRLGDRLFTRLWPDPELAAGAGQNLILAMYVIFGLPFILPLLWLEWVYLKATLRSSNRILQAAAILSLVAINHQVPSQLFYPTGGMWLLLVPAAIKFASESAESEGALRRFPTEKRMHA